MKKSPIPTFLGILVATFVTFHSVTGQANERDQECSTVPCQVISPPNRSLDDNSWARLLPTGRRSIDAHEPWLGLVGDSGITGALTDETLEPVGGAVFGLVGSFLFMPPQMQRRLGNAARSEFASEIGLEGAMDPLTRVFFSRAEWGRSPSRNSAMTSESRAQLLTNVSEYSFGYLVGRALGFASNRIVLVGQDGTRSNDVALQFARFRELSPTLPSLVFVSFSGNDICNRQVTQPTELFRNYFKNTLTDRLQRILAEGRPHPVHGTRVVVTAPLNLTNPVFNPALLDQKVRFHMAGEITCGRLRSTQPFDEPMERLMQSGLISMCRGILTPTDNPEALHAKVIDLQRAQREVWQEVIAALPARAGWSFEYTDVTHNVEFRTGDLANDCFHPGVGGHSQIARSLLRDLRERAVSAP